MYSVNLLKTMGLVAMGGLLLGNLAGCPTENDLGGNPSTDSGGGTGRTGTRPGTNPVTGPVAGPTNPSGPTTPTTPTNPTNPTTPTDPTNPTNPTNPTPTNPGAPVRPLIADIPNQQIIVGAPYVGPTPVLSQGTTPITWSLELGPADMTIDARTGVVRWAAPIVSGQTILIAASGPGGFDTEGWTLTVSPAAIPQQVFRVSLSSDGGPPNRSSNEAYVSEDGRFAAFSSESTNIVPEDDDEIADIYLHDRTSGATRLLTFTPVGQTPRPSRNPVISGNSAIVAFTSFDTSLVPGDLANHADIFIYNIATQQITRATVGLGGAEANGSSDDADLSADGNIVVFDSAASNLVENDTNGTVDVFLQIRSTGRIRRISVSSTGEQANGESVKPAISPDGRVVAFMSRATNLIADDTNDVGDVFIHDTVTGETTRIPPVTLDGEPPNDESQSVDISGTNGRYLVFTSGATNLVPGDDDTADDIFWFDRETGELRRVTVNAAGVGANGPSGVAQVSADGRFVVFQSSADNLVAGDTNSRFDVFVKDMQTGTVRLMSANDSGVIGNGQSLRPMITANGRFVAFESKATNLSLDDSNDLSDVFIRDLSQ